MVKSSILSLTQIRDPWPMVLRKQHIVMYVSYLSVTVGYKKEIKTENNDILTVHQNLSVAPKCRQH